MFYLRRLFFVLGAVVILMGCSGIKLNPSYHSDGTYLYVHKGDTLYSLAKNNNIPMRDLIKQNALKAPYVLYEGQKLKIPQQQTHTVQKGETLYSISRRHNMSVSALSRLNNLKEPYVISVGQVLKVNSTDTVSAGGAAKQSTAKKDTSVKTAAKSAAKPTTAKTQKQVAAKQPTSRRAASVPKTQATKKFAWPVKGKVIAKFGSKQKMMQNDGINISAAKGASVVAAESGTVGYAGNQLKGYGNLILIRHDNGWMTAYAHTDKMLVKKDQKVKKGQKIATVGKTGNVTSPQLHFEIRYQTKVVNPEKYLP